MRIMKLLAGTFLILANIWFWCIGNLYGLSDHCMSIIAVATGALMIYESLDEWQESK